MKNLFGSDKASGKFNGEKFVVRTTDNSEAENKLCDVLERNLSAVRQTVFPFWVLITAFVLIVGGMIMIAFMSAAETDEEKQTCFIVATIGAILTVAGLVILLINFLKMRKLKASPYYQSLLEEEKKAEKLCLEYLGVPESAEDIQILVTCEDKKNPLYSLQIKKIYRDGEYLYITDCSEVTAVPLKYITVIQKIPLKTRFYNPDEEKPMKRAEAKQAGLKIDRYGKYTAACRYSARITNGAEEPEIAIPPYELEKFLKYVNATLID